MSTLHTAASADDFRALPNHGRVVYTDRTDAIDGVAYNLPFDFGN